MSTDNPTPWRARFYALAQTSPDDGVRFWFARDLLKTLGCDRYAPFMTLIRRAAAACEAAGTDRTPHFRGVLKISLDDRGGQRVSQDYKLSRYACHLLLSAIDSRREPVAFAREYFAPPKPKQAKVEARKNDKPRVDAAPDQAPAAVTAPAPAEATAQPSSPAQEPESNRPKNPWAEGLAKRRDNQGTGSRFIPGGQSQGNRHQNRNASWNPNLAVGRGHPNSAARNSR